MQFMVAEFRVSDEFMATAQQRLQWCDPSYGDNGQRRIYDGNGRRRTHGDKGQKKGASLRGMLAARTCEDIHLRNCEI
jgi:hypothetical protein